MGSLMKGASPGPGVDNSILGGVATPNGSPTKDPSTLNTRLASVLGGVQSGLQQEQQPMASPVIPMNLAQIPQYSPDQLGRQNMSPYANKRKQ